MAIAVCRAENGSLRGNNANMLCDVSNDPSLLKESRSMLKRILYLVVYEPCVPLTGAGPRTAEFVNALATQFVLDLVYIKLWIKFSD
jgi:hypothetical protein